MGEQRAVLVLLLLRVLLQAPAPSGTTRPSVRKAGGGCTTRERVDPFLRQHARQRALGSTPA
eukprot:12163559-Alexandrium_andersonii.AAC.1